MFDWVVDMSIVDMSIVDTSTNGETTHRKLTESSQETLRQNVS